MTYDLHALVRENKIDAIKGAIANGADINGRDEMGMTPLLSALWSASLSDLWGNEEGVKDETVKCLLNYNPDVMITDYSGTTPLHLAALRNDIKFIKALIERGADINARDKFNAATPLLKILGSSRCVERDLGTSRRWHDIEVIKCLLENGADINAQNEKGLTLLMEALANRFACNETHIVLLLRYNPDVTISNYNGSNALTLMMNRDDLSDRIKGKILLLSAPDLRMWWEERFKISKLYSNKIPQELDDMIMAHVLSPRYPEIPLDKKLRWLEAHDEERLGIGKEQAPEEEQALTYETGCRP